MLHQPTLTASKETPSEVEFAHLKTLKEFQHLFPKEHIAYLKKMKGEGVEPRVIYDVGASVLHWTREAKKVWPHALYFAFEAMHEASTLYIEEDVQYHIGVLSYQDDKEIKFYVSPEHPGGNSYYKENPAISKGASEHFLESNARSMKTITLDTVVREKGWPAPDLIKMDVQGAEMDVLRGAQQCLKTCKDLIVELQKVPYNQGAPLREEVIAYIESIGFRLKEGPFYEAKYDGDYHFTTLDRVSR